MSLQSPSITTAGVPFVDLAPSHAQLKDRILADIGSVVDSSAFINGPAVAEFEAAFASYVGTAHCVGLASGLDALRLALIACGVGPGDEVLVPANTFVATFEAVSQAGATPVPVEASESDYNIDVAAAASAVGEATAAILPVHLYGQLADLRALEELAAAHGLALFEDACQAHGATRDGVRAGAVGRASAFSFYPGKNLGAMGDAGALTTNDAAVAADVRALREHGQTDKYRHEYEGWTARLDTVQAVVLLHKLPLLDEWNEQRRRIAALYGEALDGVGDLRLPPVAAGSDPVWHLFVVRTADPAALGAHLAARRIGTGRHYPQPAHLSPAYAHLGYVEGAFPVAEALCRELLSLPMYPGMTEGHVAVVAEAVADYFRGERAG